MKKQIVIGFIVGILLLTVAYFWFLSRGDNANVNIKAPGTSVKVDGNKVDIKAPGTSIKVDEGVEIKSETKNLNNETITNEEVENKSNTVLIFDSSGSMAEKVQGKTKMETAKKACENFIDELAKEQGSNLSIVVYGHKGSNKASDKAVSCAGIEEIYQMSAVNSTVIKNSISALSANGWTPIADSLEKAKIILSKNNSEGVNNSVILVSDGEETCGGDPIKKAQELCKSNINIITNVIGFNVSGAEESQLRAIANAGCGKYYSVNSEQELNDAFVKIKGNMIDINSGDGSSVHVDDNNVNIEAPDAKIDVSDGGVDINAPGASIKVDGDNVKIKVPGVDLDL